MIWVAKLPGASLVRHSLFSTHHVGFAELVHESLVDLLVQILKVRQHGLVTCQLVDEVLLLLGIGKLECILYGEHEQLLLVVRK